MKKCLLLYLPKLIIIIKPQCNTKIQNTLGAFLFSSKANRVMKMTIFIYIFSVQTNLHAKKSFTFLNLMGYLTPHTKKKSILLYTTHEAYFYHSSRKKKYLKTEAACETDVLFKLMKRKIPFASEQHSGNIHCKSSIKETNLTLNLLHSIYYYQRISTLTYK